jgi:hypothetical protein
MKHYYPFLFVLAILLGICKSSFAQTHARAAIGRVAIAGSRPPANNNKTHYTYNYTITLKDGRTVQMNGHIKPAKAPNTFVLVSSQQNKEISPNETLQITRTDPQGLVITGTPNRGKWLFPVISGDINGYSTYAENKPSYLTHFSKAGTTSLIPFKTRTRKERAQTAASLRNFVKGHEEAEALLDKHERKARNKQLTIKVIETYNESGSQKITLKPEGLPD